MQQLPAKTSPKWLALTAQGIAAVVLFAMTASLLPGQEAGLRAHPHHARTRPRPPAWGGSRARDRRPQVACFLLVLTAYRRRRSGREEVLGGGVFGGGLGLADGLGLGNGGSSVHLLNHAIAGEWNHPGWGCCPSLGEVGVHRLGAVVVDEVIFHVLGLGARDDESKGAAGGCQNGPWSPLCADPQKLFNHGGSPSAAGFIDFRTWLVQKTTAWIPLSINPAPLPVIPVLTGRPSCNST